MQHSVSRRLGGSIVLAVAGVFAASAAQAAPTYHLVDLGAFVGVTDINARGDVSGYAGSGELGLWKNGTWHWSTKVDTQAAIDDADDVLSHWQALAPPARLGLRLRDGSRRVLRADTIDSASAIALGNDLTAVGQGGRFVAEGKQRLCAIWQPGQVDATLLPATDGSSCMPAGVDAAGRVYGTAQPAPQAPFQAFVWVDGVQQFISGGGPDAYVHGVNAAGHLAMTAGDDSSNGAAWYDGTQIVRLDDPAGATGAAAWGIDAADEIVGNAISTTTHGYVAYWFRPGPAVPLSSLVDNADGWTMQDALKMNARGDIIGDGLLGGQPHAFLLQRTGG